MDDRDYEKLLAQVVRLERRWLDLYCDPARNLIVAADPPGEQVSTDRKRMTLLESRLRRVASDLEDILPDVGRLDAVRQRVLIHMAFNMGVERLRARFISAVQSGSLGSRSAGDDDFGLGKTRQAASQRVGRDDADGSGRARSVSERRSGQGPRR